MKRDNDCERDVLRIEDNPGFKSALPIRNLKRKKKRCIRLFHRERIRRTRGMFRRESIVAINDLTVNG